MNLRGRHFLSTLDFRPEDLRGLAEAAIELKRARGPNRDHPARTLPDRPLDGRVLVLLFFNPSVRTRVSCGAAMARLGGQAIELHPGADTWSFETGEGAVMDGSTQEHVRELAPVLSRYADAVGIRKSELITAGAQSAAGKASWDELRRDEFLHRFAEFSRVPVINLESNAFHPCQGLADMATMIEKLGDPRGQKYVLTWAWHPKALPVATPHSQLLAAADLGMRVTLLRPKGYELDPAVFAAAKERAQQMGGSLEETDDIGAAYAGARAVCAKSWGALSFYGRWEEEARAKAPLRRTWIVDEAKLASTDGAFFMHCLPVRRNVVVADEVLDSARSVVVDQAENRMWTAAALLRALIGE